MTPFDPLTPLAELPIFVIDCQATSSSAKTGHLIDIAWSATRACDDELAIESTLVGLAEGVELPGRVAALTGILDADLAGAPDAVDVAMKLRAALDAWSGSFLVAHWARYERGFVDRLLGNSELEWLCTHSVAKRLVPGLPSKGLRAVAGYFGRTLTESKRASEHVDATVFVWREMVAELAAEGVENAQDLAEWMARPPVAAEARTYPLPREKRLGVPQKPGVYRMLGRDGTVLYVGKATCLKDRVNSYFRQRRLAPDKKELVCQVWDLDVTTTSSALEAALLEADEIKRLVPRYNHQLRRDTRQVAWASPLDLRDLAPAEDESHTLGPFSSPWACGHFADVFDLLTDAGASGWYADLDPEIVSEGVAEFREKWGVTSPSLDEFLALGARVFDARESDDADDDEEQAEPASEEGEVSVSTIVRFLEHGASSAYRAVRRGELLRALTASRIRWAPHGAPSTLRELQFNETIVDVDSYDRLSVLLIELRRMVRDGREVSVFTANQTFDSEALARHLETF